MGGWADVLRMEVRHAGRRLRKSPGFTMAVVAALGLGVGANAAMFELVDRTLLRAPPYLLEPDAVHRVYIDRAAREGRVHDASFSHPGARDVRAGTSTFDVLAAVASTTPFVEVGGDAEPRPVDAVSAEFWRLFDMRPALGRFFSVDDDRLPNGRAVAVLEHGAWRTRFGGDPDVVGRTVRIGTRSYEIVGVAPPGFLGVDGRAPVAWVPLAAAGADIAGPDFATRPFTTWIELVGRRRPGVGIEQARAEVERAYRAHVATTRDEAAATAMDPAALLAPVLRDRGPFRSDGARLSVWLLGMSLVVLLVACANVGTLMLGRSLRRGRDAAVRAALGVGGGRSLAGPALEAALLAAAAAAVSIPLAHVAVGATARVLLPAERAAAVGLTPRSVAVGVAVALVAGGLAGLVPALRRRRPDLALLLRGGGTARSRSGWQPTLPFVQAALSSVLLVAAGLFVRSAEAVDALDLGYTADRIVLVSPESRRPPDAGSPEDHTRILREATETILRSVADVDGVEAAALTSTVPFWRNSFDPVYGPDRARLPGRFATHVVSATYFETMGTRILRGRALGPADGAGTPPVMVVSASMAARVWPGERALGRCLRIGADTMPCREVVGVAQDIRRGDVRDGQGLQFYVPWEQFYYGMPQVVAVRTAGPAATTAPRLRTELQRVVGGEVWVRTLPLRDRLDIQTRAWTTGARIFSAFGGLALLLAAFGLFSVVAFDVAQRTREFGVRTAVGARAGDLAGLVLSRGVARTAGGVAAGFLVAWTAAPRVAPLLFEVSPRDPATYGVVAAVLLATAVVACLGPALRSARVDPAVVLREE